jgi:dTDP-4-amino-4,6-dideoxygalactose transaminase
MGYSIPLFYLNFDQNEKDVLLKTLESKWISKGPQVKSFEEKFASFLGVKHVVAVSSCTAALHLALVSLGVGTNDEVIVPSLTFVATVNSVRYVGANPIFADIKSFDNFSIDPHDIKKKINDKTKAIIIMHYGGFSCDMENILDLANDNNLYLIEDAAHAPNSKFKNQKLGTIGDIGCFSFFSNKNISCAEGGAFVTDNRNYAHKARLLRSHGMTSLSFDRSKGHITEYDVVDLGFNYRLDDIRASLILSQLNKLENDGIRRTYLREVYLDNLEGLDQIIIPYKNNTWNSSNYIFPIVLRDCSEQKRDKLRAILAENGIETSVHYPAVHRFSIYKNWSTCLPKTEYIADNEITLPLYYNLKESQIEYICRIIKKTLNNG